MTVSQEQIAHAIQALGLSKKPLAVHASLRSFGIVEGGAESVVRAILQEGCTLLVPAFSSAYEAAAPLDMRPERNGCGDYSWMAPPAAAGSSEAALDSYVPSSSELDRDSMGAIPAAVLQMPGRQRGRHPLNAFAAIGPLAEELIAGQRPDYVYAPLRKLAERGGDVVLMGVGIERLTLLHLAEQMAGRTLFRRWAREASGDVIMAEVGSCSEGFGQLADVLAPHVRHAEVGASHWRIYNAAAVLTAASAAIRETPSLTHCGDPGCDRCRDAVLGGPLL